MKKYETGKIYNLLHKRPKVLLIGNGPIVANGNAILWSELIKKMSSRNVPIDQKIPYSLQATIATLDDDVSRRKKYYEVFGKEYNYRENDFLSTILALPWDVVMTTNYTYDLENVLSPRFVEIKNKAESKYVYTTKKKNKKGYGHILLRDFNRMPIGDDLFKDIWHIHGEIRNKSSIVLTHDEYARQVKALLTYNAERGNEYSDFYPEIKFKSWLDYMILGDLYIVGLGMDFSEFDLWWILNRRLREKTGKGKLYYFNPNEGREDIYAAIKMLQGECFDLGIRIQKNLNIESKLEKKRIVDENNQMYKEFYLRVINKLKKEL